MWTQGFSYLRRFISLQLTYLFSCTVGYLHTYTLIVVWYGILQILFPSLIFHAQKYDDCYVYVTMKFSNQMPAISLIRLYCSSEVPDPVISTPRGMRGCDSKGCYIECHISSNWCFWFIDTACGLWRRARQGYPI